MAETPHPSLRGIEGGAEGSMKGWGTEDPSYSEREFYTASTDSRGHRSKIQLPMPPNVAASINELVAMRRIPAYRSVQDFVRDAIIHRYHRLVELGYLDSEESQKALEQEIWHSQIIASADRTTRNEQLVRDLEKSLKLASQAGDVKELRRLLRQAREKMDDMDEPWRSKTREVVDKCNKALDGRGNKETGRSHDGKEA